MLVVDEAAVKVGVVCGVCEGCEAREQGEHEAVFARQVDVWDGEEGSGGREDQSCLDAASTMVREFLVIQSSKRSHDLQ